MIRDYLDELFLDARCELNYNYDYEFLIAVMLSAQTTDKAVNKVTEVLFKKYKNLESLKSANIEDIKNIIRPLGLYNVKSKNIIVIANCLFDVPICNNRAYLESLPGVSRKTANVVLSTLYGENCLAVDTHVSRVAILLGIASFGDSVLVIEKKLEIYFSGYNLCKLHHQLVLFGRYYCKAKNPLCDNCKLKKICNKKI